jgi:transcriptional regulator with XRE-family HTH domain
MKATPSDARPYLARTLSRLRRQSGLTRNELALLADLSRQAVSLIEEGRRADLSWGTIQQLALALGLPTDAFRDPDLAAPRDGQRMGRKRLAPVPWVRFRYVLRYRDGDGLEREEPFDRGGGWRSALVAGRELLRAGATRVRLARQRRRRDDPWEDLEEAPVPAGQLNTLFGASGRAR